MKKQFARLDRQSQAKPCVAGIIKIQHWRSLALITYKTQVMKNYHLSMLNSTITHRE
jgi:hypothetical protein